MEITKIHDISVLHFFGEVTFLEIDRIERVLESLKNTNHNKVILNLADADHVHYQVIKKLADEASKMRSINGDIKIVSANQETKEVMRFVGADQYLDDYANISECILSFLKQHGGDELYCQ